MCNSGVLLILFAGMFSNKWKPTWKFMDSGIHCPRSIVIWRDSLKQWDNQEGSKSVHSTPPRTHSFVGGVAMPLPPHKTDALIKCTQQLEHNVEIEKVIETRRKLNRRAGLLGNNIYSIVSWFIFSECELFLSDSLASRFYRSPLFWETVRVVFNRFHLIRWNKSIKLKYVFKIFIYFILYTHIL